MRSSHTLVLCCLLSLSVSQALNNTFTLNSTVGQRHERINDSLMSWHALLKSKGSAYCYANTGIDEDLGLIWVKTFFVEGDAVVKIEIDYSNGTIHETYPEPSENITMSGWYKKCYNSISTVDANNATSFLLTISMPENVLEQCSYTCLNCSLPTGLTHTNIHFGPCPTRKSWLIPLVGVAVSVSIISIFVFILIILTQKKQVDKSITEFD